MAVGNYDLCVGAFWLLPERVEMTPFTVPIDKSEFYLVITPERTEQEDRWSAHIVMTWLRTHARGCLLRWDTLEKPFRPFEGRLWLAIGLFLLFAGWVIQQTGTHMYEYI